MEVPPRLIMNKKLIAFVVGAGAILASPVLLPGENLPVSSEEQKKLTPKAVLEDLMAGNKRYVEGEVSEPNIKARIEASSS